MNEDETHPGNGNVSPATEYCPPLGDFDGGSEMMAGKSSENSPERTMASESFHVRSSRAQATMSEMHGDMVRPYGLWVAPGAPVMANVGWRGEGASRESSVCWPPLFPIRSVPGVMPTASHIQFECPPKIAGTDRSSVAERSANQDRGPKPDADLVQQRKDAAGFRPGHEQEQFNLWKMASLVHNIAPSSVADREGGRNDEVREGALRCGSPVDATGQTLERSWTYEHRAKLKSLYPSVGSETGNDNSKLHPAGIRLVEERPDGLMTVVCSRDGKSFDDVPAGPRGAEPSTVNVENQNRSQSGSHDLLREQAWIGTRDAEKGRKISSLSCESGMAKVVESCAIMPSIPNGSERPFRRENATGSCTGFLPNASDLPGLGDVRSMRVISPASVPVSESTSAAGSSLYRRRAKSLLLKQGGSLTDGVEAELPKSPRLQNHFGSAFQHGDDTAGGTAADSGFGGKCREQVGEVESGSPTTETGNGVGIGCQSGVPDERGKIAKGGRFAGMSCGVVNYATVSSEAHGEDCRPPKNSGNAGQPARDGVRSEKGVGNGVLCCHGGCGTTTLSACQYCSDVSSCHRSPSCHPPVKVPPTVVCDAAATTKCCVAHRLGALPTPTRACAAALCQLSCSGVPACSGSPKCVEGAYPFGRSTSASQCTTPCHPAANCGEVHLAAVCPFGPKARACSAKIYLPDCLPDPQPHTPCMAHTPYTPCEAFTPREPDTPQDSTGVREPCTPQSTCLHRARKYPRTPTAAACYFQFPPQLDCAGNSLCPAQSPCLSYARRLPACHTPCMSPLNLTVGQPCIAHSCTPQCCFQHPKLNACADHRHNCVSPLLSSPPPRIFFYFMINPLFLQDWPLS